MEWYTCGGFCRTCCLQYSLKSSDPPDWVLPIPLSKNLWITMVISEPDRMEYSLLGYDLRGIIEWSKIRPSWELVYCLWRSVYPALSWLETFWGLFQPEWWSWGHKRRKSFEVFHPFPSFPGLRQLLALCRLGECRSCCVADVKVMQTGVVHMLWKST